MYTFNLPIDAADAKEFYSFPARIRGVNSKLINRLYDKYCTVSNRLLLHVSHKKKCKQNGVDISNTDAKQAVLEALFYYHSVGNVEGEKAAALFFAALDEPLYAQVIKAVYILQ